MGEAHTQRKPAVPTPSEAPTGQPGPWLATEALLGHEPPTVSWRGPCALLSIWPLRPCGKEGIRVTPGQGGEGGMLPARPGVRRAQARAWDTPPSVPSSRSSQVAFPAHPLSSAPRMPRLSSELPPAPPVCLPGAAVTFPGHARPQTPTPTQPLACAPGLPATHHRLGAVFKNKRCRTLVRSLTTATATGSAWSRGVGIGHRLGRGTGGPASPWGGGWAGAGREPLGADPALR